MHGPFFYRRNCGILDRKIPKVTPEGLKVRAALLRSLLAEAPVEDRDKLEWLIDWAERTARELGT